jgi:CheY-like chemotaxis protein
MPAASEHESCSADVGSLLRGSRTRVGWQQCLRSVGRSLLVAGLWFVCSSPAADRSSTEFESSPIRNDPGQAEWLREKAREAQDLHRLRVAIPRVAQPGGVGEGPARVTTNQANGGLGPDTLPQPATVRVRDLLLGALLCLIGLVALRHLAPEATNAVFAHLLPRPAASRLKEDPSPRVPADERAFAEFLVAFKAGPRGARKSQADASTTSVSASVHNGTGSGVGTIVDPRKAFLAQAPPQLLAMRNLLQAIPPESAEATRQASLTDLCVQIRSLQDMASLPQLLPAWQLASAVGGLVSQLAQRASNVTPNRLRTVANGLDLLSDLCQPGLEPELATRPPLRLLAVDDDPIGRHAVGLALKKAFNQPDVAANSEAALAQASMISYDVIFLDILMPGMDGFELCSSIRQTSRNGNTPVVFVTLQSGFSARAKSHLAGGNDFITKPFLTFEITVKALVLALRGRLEKRKIKSPAVPVAGYVSPLVAV